MKKYLFGAMVVGVAFTSCVNDLEADLAAENNAKPISFEVAKYKASSRADASTVSDGDYGTYPTNQNFGAFAFYAAATNGEHEVLKNEDGAALQNAKVGYANNVWSTVDDTYFWPQRGHVDFVSYSPYSTDATKVPVISHVNENKGDYNKLSFVGYTVGDDDLMYSDKAHLQTHNTNVIGGSGTPSGVPTLFRHALARLNFKVQGQNLVIADPEDETKNVYWQIVVDTIQLNNLYNTGSLILQTTSPTEASTTQYEVPVNSQGYKVWTLSTSSTGSTSKVWDNNRQGQLLTTNAVDYGNATGYYVLPQAFQERVQSVTITYRVSNKVGNGSYDTPTRFSKTLYFYDYSASVKAWEVGKNITYTILIDALGDVINFDPAVTDWETVEGTLGI